MKLQLSIASGTLAGRTFDLETGFLTIGRGQTCSVRFDPNSERLASKQHAFIEARPDGFYLKDNRSTNGTFVNGSRIDTRRLASGDVIEFGRGGATASVTIDGAPAGGPEDHRQLEIKSFDRAARQEPVSVSASLKSIGLGRAVARQPTRKTSLYVGLGIAIMLSIPLVLIVIAIMFKSLGFVPALLASLIAFTPAALYILPLVGIDRYDPEPFWLLALAFAWGALVSVIVSFFVNTFFGIAVFFGSGDPDLAQVATAVISAPVVEEASKGVGLLILLIFFRRYFDDILDGIVYGGVIALGFATVENVMYYGEGLNRAYADYGASSNALLSFLFLFTLRGILSPFAHVTFTSMTGIGCGIARESHKGIVRFFMPVLGYCAAVFLHGVWNGMGIVVTAALLGVGLGGTCNSLGLGGDNLGLCGFFTGYLLLEIPLFLIFVGFIYFLMRRQRRILNDMLAIDVARGLITEKDLKTATSAIGSTRWLLGGIFAGKFRARSNYLRAIGKLGLSYWHIQRATAAQGHTGSFQQNPILREEVLRWRDNV
jgi:protease PrsW